MRPLLIDDFAKQQVRRVLDYALPKERWYRPGKDARIPGDNPRFVANLSTYRCVFTITEHGDGFAYRHLSISVPSTDYPNVFAAYMIAELFGFTGWDEKSADLPDGWMASVDKSDHCVVLAQPYEGGKVN